ncbi:hypothetical protein ACX27_08560 [Nostoc piscinale CENA21]|uniref:Pvc16 N-terminal domain-containing protein n=1 Tax=Nostoc piscinale CENA21 TaxID=224013 RepID=A0A0M3V513_9NOSO|nr:DUF4255 domain-containing protein [Nostoc piscinale]ALF52897.1 hypothetical protein ACX27_08560 [Nostoc piscinale CENA21]
MANALAIAAVTAVLKDLLNNGLIDAQLDNDVTVTALPPDRIPVNQNGQNTTQLNLFLYQVTANPAWRNEGLPTYNARGDRVCNTPLALDLHYLLTAYGSQEFEAEILLGYAMQLLHENAILNRLAIQRTFSTEAVVTGSILPRSFQSLAAANLADQVEQIKIAPKYLDMEEMSHIWSALQANYRTSTAYHVSVVLIEGQQPTRSALPVQTSNIYVTPFQPPVIEEVTPQVSATGNTLTIRGTNLRRNLTQASFNNPAVADIDLPVGTNTFTDREIRLPLPSGLLAGVNTIQIIHPLDLGTPQEPHRGFESNLAAFILRPEIVNDGNTPPTYQIQYLPDQAAFDAAIPPDVASRLTRTITPPAMRLQINLEIADTQRTLLLLNQTNPGVEPAIAYNFPDAALLLPEGQTPANTPKAAQRSPTLVFAVPNILSSSYLVRVRVDGAESPLALATDPPHPQITI